MKAFRLVLYGTEALPVVPSTARWAPGKASRAVGDLLSPGFGLKCFCLKPWALLGFLIPFGDSLGIQVYAHHVFRYVVSHNIFSQNAVSMGLK